MKSFIVALAITALSVASAAHGDDVPLKNLQSGYQYHNGAASSGASSFAVSGKPAQGVVQARGAAVVFWLDGTETGADTGFILEDGWSVELLTAYHVEGFRWEPKDRNSGATIYYNIEGKK